MFLTSDFDIFHCNKNGLHLSTMDMGGESCILVCTYDEEVGLCGEPLDDFSVMELRVLGIFDQQ